MDMHEKIQKIDSLFGILIKIQIVCLILVRLKLPFLAFLHNTMAISVFI